MKLQQFRFIWEVAHHQLNVSETAKSLFTSQPGISKHILQLENELGVEIFSRNGRNMVDITPAGEQIIKIAGEILQHVDSIHQVAQEHTDPDCGTLQLAVSHMHACYVLPPIIEYFQTLFPNVVLQLQQDSPDHLAELVRESHVHMVLTSNEYVESTELVLLPCFRWRQSIVVPRGHPLSGVGRPSLEELATYPLITYANGSAGQQELERAFAGHKMHPRIASTAADSNVIKSCVRMGMGVGVMATVVCDDLEEHGLVALDASHLFEPCINYLGVWRYAYLREFHHNFIELLAGHLNRALVEQALQLDSPEKRRRLFRKIELPLL